MSRNRGGQPRTKYGSKENVRVDVNSPTRAQNRALDPAEVSDNGIFGGPFSPGLPPALAAVPDPEPRIFDYEYGVNTAISTRGSNPREMDFEDLRSLSQLYHWSAIAVQRLIDCLKVLEWSFVPVDPNTQKMYQGEIDEMTERFKMPDGVKPWFQWSAEAYREMLEIDALPLNLVKDRKQELLYLEVIQGDTIKPIITRRGRICGYAQIIHGYVRSELSTYTNDPEDEIADIFGLEEMLYIKEHPAVYSVYGRPAAELAVQIFNSAILEEDFRQKFFTDGTLPPGLVALAKDLPVKEIERYQRLFDKAMGGNSKRRQQLQFVPGGSDVKYIPLKAMIESTVFADYYRRIILACHGVNESFMGITNTTHRSEGARQQSVMDEQTIKPHAMVLEAYINLLVQSNKGYRKPYLKFQFNYATNQKDTAAKEQELGDAIDHDIVTPEYAAQQLYPESIVQEDRDNTPLPPDKYLPPQTPTKGGGAM